LKNFIISVFGRKGSGKTTYVKKVLIPKFNRVVILDSLGEYNCFSVHSIDHLIEFLKANRNRNFFRIAYRPFDEGDHYFFKIVYSIPFLSVIVEEVDLYSSPSKTDPFLLKLLKYGRHRSIDVIGVSRRPAEVSKTLTSQADIVVSFQQTQKNELDIFKLYLDNPDELKELKVGEYKIIQGEEILASTELINRH